MKKPPSSRSPRPKTVVSPQPTTTDPVLLAAVGMSPAVLTETIWALAHPADGTEPIVPSRVMVLTTTAGRDTILNSLFQPSVALGGVAPWDALRQSLSASGHDQDLRKPVAAIRNKLRRAAGNAPLLIPCLPEKGRFSLAVPGELIHLKS